MAEISNGGLDNSSVGMGEGDGAPLWRSERRRERYDESVIYEIWRCMTKTIYLMS